MRNVLRMLCAITLLSLTASCSSTPVDIPNIYFYGDKGKYGATRVESLNPEKPGVRFPKSEWDVLRIGMVCTAASSVTDLQYVVDTLCTKNPTACNYAKDGVNQIRGALSQMKKAAVQ